MDESAPLPEAVGLIGAGKMGTAAALRLRERGVRVHAWNRSQEALAPLVAAGAIREASPGGVARCPLVAIFVTDEAATRDGSAGPQGLLSALSSTHTVVHSGTIGLRAARAFGAEVERTGASYVDAPVLGSTDRARKGELLALVGAEPEAFGRAEPFLRVLSSKILHAGPVGSGSALKLIANMLLARYVEALGEVLALTRAFELDPAQVLETLQSSALASPMWNKAKTVLAGPSPLHFSLRHMAKDLRLLDEEVDRRGLTLPAHEAVHALYQEVLARGLGDLDYSELARVIAEPLGEFTRTPPTPRTTPPSTGRS